MRSLVLISYSCTLFEQELSQNACKHVLKVGDCTKWDARGAPLSHVGAAPCRFTTCACPFTINLCRSQGYGCWPREQALWRKCDGSSRRDLQENAATDSGCARCVRCSNMLTSCNHSIIRAVSAHPPAASCCELSHKCLYLSVIHVPSTLCTGHEIRAHRDDAGAFCRRHFEPNAGKAYAQFKALYLTGKLVA